ncbi:PpiC-type peptidyl-prolyl cis-trans isomerase [Syntrophobacter sp. SbD1]|nr:PpiC-type peptidyl-prolyl cis-trans isomerase [Syntrophobacter sp. SbD1]
MKKVGLVVSGLIIFVFVAGYGFYASSAADKPPKEDAAKSAASQTKLQNAALVNGKAIPMSDYQAGIDQLDRQISMTGRQPDEKEMPALKQRILDNLISRELLSQEVAKKGIKVDDAEVNAQLETVKKGSSPEDFANSLKQMNMTEKDLKEHFASQLAIKKLVDKELTSKVAVTPEEVKAFYDKNPEVFKTPEMIRASHILVKVDKTATAEQKAKALEKIQSVQKRLQAGEDFAQVAKEVSDCPSKAEGGDLNFFQKGQMVAPFEDTAFALKTGETSGIVETEFGYHIIKVTDKKAPGTLSFDEVKSRIEQHIKSEKMSQEFPKYIDTLKAKAKIEILVKEG